jgi:hypothetical protein
LRQELIDLGEFRRAADHQVGAEGQRERGSPDAPDAICRPILGSGQSITREEAHMRAYTITTTTRRRRRTRRRVIALVLGVCALAIPASASAAPQIPHGADYSSVSAIPPPTSEPTVASDSPSDSGDGFDWGDAALGAGAAMAVVALGGAVLFTVRRRPGVSPSASTG